MPLPALIAVLPKTHGQDIHVAITEYKRRTCADIRMYADFKGDGVKMPTQKGISVSITMLPALHEAIAKMETEARRLGLLSDEGAA